MAKIRPLNSPGRKKGVPNKMTGMLKDTIIKAAELVGEDGMGKGKLLGYLKVIAMTQPKTFANLLGRIMPLQMTGEDGGAVQVTITGPDSEVL